MTHNATGTIAAKNRHLHIAQFRTIAHIDAISALIQQNHRFHHALNVFFYRHPIISPHYRFKRDSRQRCSVFSAFEDTKPEYTPTPTEDKSNNPNLFPYIHERSVRIQTPAGSSFFASAAPKQPPPATGSQSHRRHSRNRWKTARTYCACPGSGTHHQKQNHDTARKACPPVATVADIVQKQYQHPANIRQKRTTATQCKNRITAQEKCSRGKVLSVPLRAMQHQDRRRQRTESNAESYRISIHLCV